MEDFNYERLNWNHSWLLVTGLVPFKALCEEISMYLHLLRVCFPSQNRGLGGKQEIRTEDKAVGNVLIQSNIYALDNCRKQKSAAF